MKQFLVRFWSNYDNLCVSLAWPLSAVSRHYYVTEDQEGESETIRAGDKMLHSPSRDRLGSAESNITDY